jgi:hypothetical protein
MICKELKGNEMSESKNEKIPIIRIPHAGTDLRRLVSRQGGEILAEKWVRKMRTRCGRLGCLLGRNPEVVRVARAGESGYCRGEFPTNGQAR